MAPQPGETICDPACGTGGFLLAAHEYIARRITSSIAIKSGICSGTLHGDRAGGQRHAIVRHESAAARHRTDGRRAGIRRSPPRTRSPGKHGEYDMVLTNPPFGKKSSVTIDRRGRRAIDENRSPSTATISGQRTSNKQLNFLQHIFTILKQHGRAAVVVPDNVLFEGGAGETIRRALLKQARRPHAAAPAHRHLLRQGVKANVLFFDRKPAQETVDGNAMDLRSAHEQALHAQGKYPCSAAISTTSSACYNPKNRHERKPTWSEENRTGAGVPTRMKS